MNKLLALGLMALSMNTVFAANGTHTGTIDMTRREGYQVKAERLESDLVLEGRNEASNGRIQFQKNVDKNQAIKLTGRHD
tara:strand:- start:2104 stop:2343 length:240 start_codon:yes stop_codon:yes gene_type:complete